ncbi:phage tail fiber protein [Acinetobacter baumannii]|uniref:phage tail fiber protein n=1 Tax=Acinetobacter baumannii TaxID=470 RepID=UPI002741D2D0|nr:phage tail fiber protein [Acinetobacter baumannii]MDP7840848.1 phage tail fiber protein [Acinetobacter baumannii]MDP7863527.1 phage tail fiber protein [Acinetobacter baumannii]
MATNWNAVLANVNNSADILAILRKVLSLLELKVDGTTIDEVLAQLEKVAADGQITIEEALETLTFLDQKIDERTSAFNEAIEAAAAAGAGANGWTDLVIQTDIGGGKSQREVNNSVEFKKCTLEDKKLAEMLTSFNKVDFNKEEEISLPVSVPSNSTVKSNGHLLNQTTQRTSNIATAQHAEHITIEGLNLTQDKTTPIENGTNNNHSMLRTQGGRFISFINNIFDGQYGSTFTYGENTVTDRRIRFGLAAFNIYKDIQGMAIENMGAFGTRIVGNVLDSTTRGDMHFLRGSGYDRDGNTSETAHMPTHGIVGSLNVARNIRNAFSLQNSSKFFDLGENFLSDVDNVVTSTAGTTSANDPALHQFKFTAHKVKKIINAFTLNRSLFLFRADGSALTSAGVEELTGRSGTGFNAFIGLITNAAKTAFQGRYSHSLFGVQVSGSAEEGIVISGSFGGGTLIVDSCRNGVQIFGNYNNLTIIATNCSADCISVPGFGNVVNIVTNGNVSVSGPSNVINGYIGGNLTMIAPYSTDNILRGQVVGNITKAGSGNDYTGIKGWSGTIAVTGQSTDANGRITVTVPKHSSSSAQIRVIRATIPLNISRTKVEQISISGSTVIFEFRTSADALITNTAIDFNYSFSCA